MNEHGKLIELSLAIELKDFTIDEYPPKLMLIDNETGRTLPEKAPEHLLLEEGVTDGRLVDWLVTIRQTIPWAAYVAPIEWNSVNFTVSSVATEAAQGIVRRSSRGNSPRWHPSPCRKRTWNDGTLH